MQSSPYTHRPSRFAVDPEEERDVLFKGEEIGHVIKKLHGPTKGMWIWKLKWKTENNVGMVNSNKAAWNMIKRRHQDERPDLNTSQE